MGAYPDGPLSNKTWRPAQASVRRRRGIISPSPLWTVVDMQHQQPSTGCGQFRLLPAEARRENSDPCGTRVRAAYNQHDSRSPPDIFIQHSSIASTWLCMNICDPGGCTRHSSRIAAANRAPHGPTCMHVTENKNMCHGMLRCGSIHQRVCQLLHAIQHGIYPIPP